MNVKRWLARRETDWKHLDTLLRRVEKRGLKSLQAEEVKELASLYRSISGDLARAKTNAVGQNITQDLQLLTSRSYSQIYQGAKHQEWRSIRDFILWRLPKLIQQTWGYIFLATSLLVGAGIISWWYAGRDPVYLALVVPEDLITLVRDEGKLWMGSIVGVEPLASSHIMRNNLSVSFGAIGGGITAGIYTVFLLVYNGISIGAIASLVAQHNLAIPFWAFVFPHGAIELPAIFFAGGAGLLIARAILFPGKYNRINALKYYGYQAAQLTLAIVPMLIIAGIIEGFISPNPLIPDMFKYIIGTSIFTLLVLYCRRTQVSRSS
jgi:uncharacterized membrane protein SpoIIM required for sporulation